MKELAEYKEVIHSCSKCGLCQAECPIYQITGNDCSVSRGQFIMLNGLIKGDLKMTKNLNKYLDMCLKCGACSKFCPSGIDIVDVIASAKAEYFKTSFWEKLVSFIQRNFVFGFIVKLISMFHLKRKSKTFAKKVIYFGGCGSKIKGNDSVIDILNACNIEVITPDFDCCGIPFYVRGDKNSFEKYKQDFINKLSQYDNYDIVTTCASCEKTIKSYLPEGYNVKNIYQYIRENDFEFELKKEKKVTFHKPCNIENYDDILWILNKTKNLNYVEMRDFDKCCGLNGVTKFSHYKVFTQLFKEKVRNIELSGSKIVLTSCLGCEVALMFYSLIRYRVYDLLEFLNKNSVKQSRKV